MAFGHAFTYAAQKVVQSLVLMFFVNFEQNSPCRDWFFLCFQFFLFYQLGRFRYNRTIAWEASEITSGYAPQRFYLVGVPPTLDGGNDG